MQYVIVVHYELLEHGKTISADIYCKQLYRVNEVLRRKYSVLINRNGVIKSYLSKHVTFNKRFVYPIKLFAINICTDGPSIPQQIVVDDTNHIPLGTRSSSGFGSVTVFSFCDNLRMPIFHHL